MELRVLGPLEAVDADGRLVPLAPKERAVLARLALEPGVEVTDDALRDAVWPRDPPVTAAKTMAGYVHRLRQRLGVAVVVRRAAGYALGPDVGVDVRTLDATVDGARRAAAAGDHGSAADSFATAAALFRGRPFLELDDVPEALVERARLREVRNCVDEERFDIRSSDGRARELIPELEAFVAREPTRERAWGQLMAAYASSLRRADALHAYARARRTLSEELGIEPGPALQAQHRLLLQQDETSLAAAPAPPRSSGLDAVTLDRLVDREHERARIDEALEGHRLVTLVGGGGVGKTRLAHHILRDRPLVRLVELAPVDRDGVGAALLRGLGVDELPGRSPGEAASHWGADRPVIVLLDNCEHVVDEAAEVAVSLLRSTSGLRILATSRERLRVRGEHVVDIEPLPTPRVDADVPGSPAVELFLERAAAAGVVVDVDDVDERAAVAEICRQLDGLPLALEIGAAQLRARSLDDLLGGLDDLPVAPRGVPERQRSLDALVAWSEGLLGAAERAAFRRLSVFPGDFGIDAAIAVMAGDPVAPGGERVALATLVETSLVVADRRPGRPHRYRLLETVRRHARRSLRVAGEDRAAADALLRWALGLVARIEPDVRTTRQDGAMALAARERLAITAAFDHARAVGDDLAALRLIATVPIGLLAERESALRQLLAVVSDAPAPLRARAWAALANVASDRGDAGATVEAAIESLRSAELAGDPAQAVWARYFVVHGRWASGDLDGLDDAIAEAIDGFRAIGSAHGVASMHWIGSLVADDLDAARGLADEAVRAFRELGIPSGLAHALEGRALVAMRTGDAITVRADLAESLDIVSRDGNPGCTSHCIEAVAAFVAERGRHEEARTLAAAADALRESTGHGRRVWERESRRRLEAALGDATAGVSVATDVDLVDAARQAQETLARASD